MEPDNFLELKKSCNDQHLERSEGFLEFRRHLFLKKGGAKKEVRSDSPALCSLVDAFLLEVIKITVFRCDLPDGVTVKRAGLGRCQLRFHLMLLLFPPSLTSH